MFISLITPAYNEGRNLPVLYERLCSVLDTIDAEWKWIVAVPTPKIVTAVDSRSITIDKTNV